LKRERESDFAIVSDRPAFLTISERFMTVYELFWPLKGSQTPKNGRNRSWNVQELSEEKFCGIVILFILFKVEFLLFKGGFYFRISTSKVEFSNRSNF
jgi:hypothetical protein